MASQFSVIIVGGGAIGLTLAKALADHAISVTVVESHKPNLVWSDTNPTARVYALNQASIQILKNLGIWSSIPPQSKSVLHRMDIWDHAYAGQIQFCATQIPSPQLGQIVENRAIVKALWEDLEKHSQVTLIHSAKPTEIISNTNHCQLTLTDGQVLKSSLIIGADGPQSWVRQHALFRYHQRPYHHDALTTVIETDQPHQQTALQQFLPNGPIGILPLHDANQSSIVWSSSTSHIDELSKLSRDTLGIAVAEAINHRWGKVNVILSNHRFPLTMRHVSHYYKNRTALIGDAAHTIHPLAGVGANLGLFDAAVLAECLITHVNKKNYSLPSALQHYQRWCRPRNSVFLNSLRLIKDCFNHDSGFARRVASNGLNLVDSNLWIKSQFAKQAMAIHDDLPSLAQ